MKLKKQTVLFLWILIITPLGFLSKAYQGPAASWVNNSLSGALYVIFWCWVAAFFLPNARARNIAAGVFAATSLLEVAQLWHPPFLEYLRSFYLGKVILGTTFAWSDFFYYALGAGFAYLSLRRWPERKHITPKKSE